MLFLNLDSIFLNLSIFIRPSLDPNGDPTHLIFTNGFSVNFYWRQVVNMVVYQCDEISVRALLY